MKTVLIIETDLGLVFWLGHTLDAAGIRFGRQKAVLTSRR